jgi:hypothetical protein
MKQTLNPKIFIVLHLDVVVHSYNQHSGDLGRKIKVQGQPGYIIRPCLLGRKNYSLCYSVSFITEKLAKTYIFRGIVLIKLWRIVQLK